MTKKYNAQHLMFLAVLIFASLSEILEILLSLSIVGKTLWLFVFWGFYVFWIDNKADRRMTFFETTAIQTFGFVVWFFSTQIVEGIINGILGL